MSPRNANVSLALATLLLLFAFATATPAEPTAPLNPAHVAFFESKIRPLLVERCYKCHSAESGKSKGGLRLDTRDALFAGGEHGPSVVPGKPDQSPLIRAVRYTDDHLQMPPKERLPDREIADLVAWVTMGAPDPRTAPPAGNPTTRPADLWSLKPIRAPEPPAVKNAQWPAGPIDRFVLATLEANGLGRAQAASRRELLRRVTFDLTGLPPTPEEMQAFLADPAPDAYERVVDRLLASPRHGERWARHWLDVVRFGESHGYEQNHLRPNAWPYRDYVIRALNADKPYDQFVAEQLAGDVVAAGTPDEAATGFLVAGVHDTVLNRAEQARRQQRADDLDDLTSTVGATFLGLTVGCAKCHDHKFDPIPQRDYYALAAVFAGVRHEERPLPTGATQPNPPPPARPALNARRNVDAFPPTAARFVRFVVLATDNGATPCIDELEVYADPSGPNLALASAGAKASASSLLPGYPIHQIAHLNDGRYGNAHSWIGNEPGTNWAQIELPSVALVSTVAWGRDGSPSPKYSDRVPVRYRIDVSVDGKAWTTVSTEAGRGGPTSPPAYIGRFATPEPIFLLKRGDVMQRGDEVAPAGLSRLPGLPPELEAPAHQSEPGRRVALAKWIGDPRNPLTARVIVNRIWQYHFGRGIVATPSDFGLNGEPPSHPDLLDWLADDFVRGGWRMKRLHRQIVLSNTYRQAATPHPGALAAGLATDAGNRLLWRAPLQRLQAEAVRDAILATAGTLDLSPAATSGPGFQLFKYRVVNIGLYDPRPDQGPPTWRRAVFQQTARSIHDELMAVFDEPENAQRTPRREVTTNALQAMALLNAPFVVNQSDLFAQRVRREAGDAIPAQVDRAFVLAFGRPPEPTERDEAAAFTTARGLPALCRALFNANEFLTY